MLEQRLRFETLLSELSAGLIHIPASNIDAALERGLGQVVAFLRADRGSLDEYDGSAARVRVSWPQQPQAGERAPRIMEAGHFPWTGEKLRRGDIVRFSRTHDLPAEAATDRASYERLGTRSHVSLPLRAGGRLLGVLSFDCVRSERVWSDELVDRLRLLAEAFASALERQRIEISLAERLGFEQLLSSLSTTLSNVSAVDHDRELRRGLRRIVDFLAVDRGRLIELSREGATVGSWAAEDGANASDLPWTTALVHRGHVVAFSRIQELPEEAAVDRCSYLASGIKSQVALPLLSGGRVVGTLVLSTVRSERAWQQDGLIQRLQLVGEVFANTLARKQAELEAQRLRQELAHIGRVSAMGELTASLAHELNQPLTAILNNAQVGQRFLAADVPNLAEVREILNDIVADDKRAAEVIRRLRLLLRKGDLEYAPLDLNDIVSDVARLMMGDAAIREVAMSLELAAGLPTVLGDRVQLQQVVLNLVLNGLDAVREAAAGDRRLVIRTSRDGPAFVGVAVQDSGTGLTGKDAERIFEPLYTTKPDGIGMGLAIARTIVDAHGGRLSAVNNNEGGATFHFTLPVSAEVKR